MLEKILRKGSKETWQTFLTCLTIIVLCVGGMFYSEPGIWERECPFGEYSCQNGSSEFMIGKSFVKHCMPDSPKKREESRIPIEFCKTCNQGFYLDKLMRSCRKI